MRKYWIETYGCQMNKAESEAIVLQLKELGWTEAGSSSDSDLIVLNTCSVRITAEERIWGRLGFFRHEKKRRNFKLIVTGCMAERLKDELLNAAPEVDLIIGNFNKHHIIQYIEYALERDEKRAFTEPGEYVFSPVHGARSFKAFVPIMHGCNNYCSYCIVPYVRGREISRNPDDIMNEISVLLENGVKEITLLGQNVNSYHYENGNCIVSFEDLVDSVSEAAGDSAWIRFLTSHPKDLRPQLIQLIASRKNICRHIHLPMQHASDRILTQMNRKYSFAYYKELVETIRSSIPGISVTSDILIGFPGESKEDFDFTLEALREIGFDDAFTYKYNPREGTKAFSMKDDVSENTKLERLDSVIKLQRSISFAKKKAKLGRSIKALVENVSKKKANELLARTECDEMSVFHGEKEKIGSFVQIELSGLSGNTFRGKETVPCHGS